MPASDGQQGLAGPGPREPNGPTAVLTVLHADRTVAAPAARRDPDDTCWCCAGRTVKHHCKIVCTNCGFMRDCSDP